MNEVFPLPSLSPLFFLLSEDTCLEIGFPGIWEGMVGCFLFSRQENIKMLLQKDIKGLLIWGVLVGCLYTMFLWT